MNKTPFKRGKVGKTLSHVTLVERHKRGIADVPLLSGDLLMVTFTRAFSISMRKPPYLYSKSCLF